jgi:hypothetical protein
VLVARLEEHIGAKKEVAVMLDRVLVLVLGWMDDDARRPRPIRVWGLGHMWLSSLSHASRFFNHHIDFHLRTAVNAYEERLDRKVVILCFAHSMPCCISI